MFVRSTKPGGGGENSGEEIDLGVEREKKKIVRIYTIINPVAAVAVIYRVVEPARG